MPMKLLTKSEASNSSVKRAVSPACPATPKDVQDALRGNDRNTIVLLLKK
jgi:hypothetical protein